MQRCSPARWCSTTCSSCPTTWVASRSAPDSHSCYLSTTTAKSWFVATSCKLFCCLPLGWCARGRNTTAHCSSSHLWWLSIDRDSLRECRCETSRFALRHCWCSPPYRGASFSSISSKAESPSTSSTIRRRVCLRALPSIWECSSCFPTISGLVPA